MKHLTSIVKIERVVRRDPLYLKYTLLLLLFLTAACNEKKKSDEIVIGLVSSITGEDSKYGVSFAGGVLLAVEELNSKGGIRGRKVKLVKCDDSSDYRTTLSAAEDLIVTHNPLAIIGEVVCNRTMALITVGNRNQVPIISPAATGSSLVERSNCFFRFSFSDSIQAKSLVSFLKTLQAKGNKDQALSVVVLKDIHSEYSVGFSDYFRKECEGRFRILTEISIDNSDTAFSEEIGLVTKLRPDVIFLPLYQRSANRIIKSFKARGVKATFMGGDGLLGSELLKEKGKEFESVIYSAHHFELDSSVALIDFAKHYRLFNRLEADELSALAYDATFFLFLAIEESLKQTEIPTTKDVIESLNRIHEFEGITGKRTFVNRSGQSNPTLVRVKSQKLEKVE